ncbi:MAG: DUF167 domain-containing protein [Aeoliella sp.]
MIDLSQRERGVVVAIRARAGGSRNGVTGVHDGALAVSVTQVPEGGKANRALIAVLAKLFGCGKRRIELVAGNTSHSKRFLLVDMNRDEVLRHIEAALAN